MIKQEIEDRENGDDLQRCTTTPDSLRMTSLETLVAVAHESGLHPALCNKGFEQQYRHQQEQIATRLHLAVTENFKLITNTKNNNYSNCDRTSASILSLGGNRNSNRLAVRNFCSKTNLDLKSNKSASSENLSILLDNDGNNNNNINNNTNSHHHHQEVVGENDDAADNNNSNYLLPCPLCEIPLEPRVFRQHLDRHYPRDSPVCPVLQCGRRFAHPNSVRNHMRLKHTLQWAKMKAMRSSGGPFSGIPY